MTIVDRVIDPRKKGGRVAPSATLLGSSKNTLGPLRRNPLAKVTKAAHTEALIAGRTGRLATRPAFRPDMGQRIRPPRPTGSVQSQPEGHRSAQAGSSGPRPSANSSSQRHPNNSATPGARSSARPSGNPIRPSNANASHAPPPLASSGNHTLPADTIPPRPRLSEQPRSQTSTPNVATSRPQPPQGLSSRARAPGTGVEDTPQQAAIAQMRRIAGSATPPQQVPSAPSPPPSSSQGINRNKRPHTGVLISNKKRRL